MNNDIHFGRHTVTELLHHRPHAIEKILLIEHAQTLTAQSNLSHPNALKQILELANQHHIMIEYLPRHQLDKLSRNGNHQGVIAECQRVKQSNTHDLETLLDSLDHPPLLLILDGVQDPHNLGACLRSAAAANADAVIIPKDRAVGLTATVRKVACGAAETVPLIQVTNLTRLMAQLKQRNIWIYGTCAQAQQHWHEADYTIPVAFVMGAEGRGLRRLTQKHCDAHIAIPMNSKMASLNVSVATAICLFEAVRQRKNFPGALSGDFDT